MAAPPVHFHTTQLLDHMVARKRGITNVVNGRVAFMMAIVHGCTSTMITIHTIEALHHVVFVRCNLNCEILTISADPSRRIIDSSPPIQVNKFSEYIHLWSY